MRLDNTSYQSELDFSETSGFFATSSLTDLAKQLVDLAHGEAHVIAVEGDAGAGKSKFAQHLVSNHFVASSLDSIPTVFIQLPESIAIDPFFEFLCQQIGLPNASEPLGQKLVDLRAYVQDLVREGLQAVIVIDDAFHLGDDTLAALFSVIDVDHYGVGVQFILTGGLGFSSHLDELMTMELGVHDFTMPQFSPTELERLVKQTRPDLAALMEGELKSWTRQTLWTKARGFPGIAVALLESSLSKSKIVYETSEDKSRKTDDVSKKPSWPYAHSVILGGLLLALIWVGFSKRSSEGHIVKELAAKEPAFVSVDNASSRTLKSKLGTNIDETVRVSKAMLPPSLSGVESSKKRVKLSAPKARVKPVPRVVDKISGELVSVKNESEAGGESYSRARAKPVNVSGLESAVENDQYQTVLRHTAEDSSVANDREALAAHSGDVRSDDLSQELPELDGSDGAESDAENDTALLSKLGLSPDERFLMSLPEGDYVLQILAGGQEASARSFVAAHAGVVNMHVYRTMRGSKPWYVVVLASFSSRAAALEVIPSLPESLKAASPWVKSLSDVSLEIVANRES